MSRRHGHPALLGLFVVGALVLLFVTVFTVAGGKLFAGKQRVVMHFNGSIYGLQVGAPVVFRGVRLGSVSAIGVAFDKTSHAVTIPVAADLERELLANLTESGETGAAGVLLPAMVQRGLRAQLAMQSLLTGQLYIDLDFRPGKPGEILASSDPQTEIPTLTTPLQDLKNQVDGLDIKRLVGDLSTIASSGRRLVEGPELSRAIKDLERTTANLSHLTLQLDRRIGPLSDATLATLEATRQAMDKMSRSAVTVNDSAQRVGASFGPDSPLLQSLRRSAEEISRSAVTLREATGNEAPLNQNLQRALLDLSQAARSLRELADTLDQQPESVLKGRR